MKASFIALIVGGILIILSIMIFIINISVFTPEEIVGTILLLAIAVSTHGLLLKENNVDFNPVMGEYKPSR